MQFLYTWRVPEFYVDGISINRQIGRIIIKPVTHVIILTEELDRMHSVFGHVREVYTGRKVTYTVGATDNLTELVV